MSGMNETMISYERSSYLENDVAKKEIHHRHGDSRLYSSRILTVKRNERGKTRRERETATDDRRALEDVHTQRPIIMRVLDDYPTVATGSSDF